MKVKDIMSTQVEYATPETSVKEAAHIMHDLHVGILPVIDDRRIVGVITDRDICCKVIATGHSAGWTKVAEVMSKNVTTCHEEADIGDATNIMIENHIRRLAVVNRSDDMVGLLSVDDVARCSHDMASCVLEASTQLH
ncbi:hypothetical protein MNBD_GAMMA09-2700 [hydrothermal vent metagenome]|uniref:CBS domain-containing protein n=1 Tax=hydrothermal vent metagenome TaxID=652676 RepID=A0A3B0XSJ5_9ZZZZ